MTDEDKSFSTRKKKSFMSKRVYKTNTKHNTIMCMSVNLSLCEKVYMSHVAFTIRAVL